MHACMCARPAVVPVRFFGGVLEEQRPPPRGEGEAEALGVLDIALSAGHPQWAVVVAGACVQGELRLLCSSGCRDWTLENARSEDCRTGKSASNALVGRRDMDTTKRDNLLRALGLGNNDVADVRGDRDTLLDESSVGFWSKETKQLKKLTATDDGFRDFFSALDNFKEIQESEVSPQQLLGNSWLLPLACCSHLALV